MSPTYTFLSGFGLLILFAWYFLTDSARARRILGSMLTVLVIALCLAAINPPSEKIQLGLDLKGGTSFLIRLVQEEVEVTAADGKTTKETRLITPAMVDQAVEVIRKRVDAFGTSEPVITPQGTDRILVQIPGLDLAKLKDIREQLQKVAKLEFRKVHTQSAGIVAGTVPPDPAYTRMPHVEVDEGKNVDRGEIIVRKKVDLEGKHVVRAGAGFEAKGWLVHILFDHDGADIFGKLTTEVYEDHSALAIILDGKVISAPGVHEGPILGGRCEISGNFDEKSARNLASALENPLQTPVVIEEERSVSASLGGGSIEAGLRAGYIGFAAVVVLMLCYYLFAGLIANLALLINVAIMFGCFAMFNTVLTLPGIAGLILTLGVAVDANVLIYERLREELAEGKTFKAALILFWKSAGPVKGFAIALTIGIIGSMFCALVVSRVVFSWLIKVGWLKQLKMLQLVKNPKVNFMGWRRPAVAGSVSLIIALGIVFALRGEKNFGVDFKGGDRLTLAAKSKPSDDQVREALKPLNLGEVVVQTEKTGDKEFLTVRSAAGTAAAIAERLEKAFPDAGLVEAQREHVGTLVGGELAQSSLIALGLGVLAILLFVSARFELSFAVGALVALLHDVLITLGAYALFGRELSLVSVGAVLTIAGYSINDTIVVYDRIREGIKMRRRGSIQDIMNASINETLSRTFLTGSTALLPGLSLFFFGGPVLADFAFAIIVGVLVGTYSSIFVASPIVLWWSRKGGLDLVEEIRRSEAQTEVAT
jgi:SecD/SecF fusion protein